MDTEKRVIELDLNDILPNRFQPRIKFNEEAIIELSDSIREHGVVQPIIVRPMGNKFEIIAGERRYKASLIAEKTTIPAIISELSDKQCAEVALIENVQRKDLTSIEEAISYKKILDMGNITQQELATKLGKKQSTIANKIRLLHLDDEVQEALLDEKISERHARSLLKLTDTKKQRQLLTRIINDRLTVRKTDEEIAKMLAPDEPSSDDQKIIDRPLQSALLGPQVKDEEFNPFKMDPLPLQSPEIIGIEEEPIIIIEEEKDIMDFRDTNTISTTEPSESGIFDPFKSVTNSIEPPRETFFTDIPTFPESASPISAPIVEASIINEPIDNSFAMPSEPSFPDFSDSFAINEIKQDEGINPGFMDISGIESSAFDINVSRPEADLNTLLQPTELPVIESLSGMPVTEVTLDKPLVEEEHTFFMPRKKEIPEEKPAISGGDPFNFMPEPVPVITQTETVPVFPAPQSSVISTLPSLSEFEVKSSLAESSIFESTVSTPIIETALPIDEPTEVDYLNPNFDFNVAAPVIREEIKLEDAFTIDTPPVLPEVTVPNFSTLPVLESAIENPSVVSVPTSAKDIGLAVEAIKECHRKITELGFKVDVEQFDSEYIYNVTFKVEK